MADTSELVRNLRNGDRRALARVLSYIEDAGREGEECVKQLFPHTGGAYVLGITGSPGAGKSTLVDRLVSALIADGQKVGVIAVDPSSPFTGGALLGDRIRMSNSSENPSVFIRSMASRGAVGGLSAKTSEAIFAFDAAGFDFIIVETVGVGQGEVEIVKTADSVFVVLVPGMGDGVQALKAGILEIADVFVINKADYDGADRLEKELRTMISLGPKEDWKPPIVRTVASEGTGTAELVAEMKKHRTHAEASGRKVDRRKSFLKETFERRLAGMLFDDAIAAAEKKRLLPFLMEELFSRKKSPLECATEVRAVAAAKGRSKK